MTDPKNPTNDHDFAIRERVLTRAKTITADFMTRLSIAYDDLEAGHHRAALGALDGAEKLVADLRSLLRLLEG